MPGSQNQVTGGFDRLATFKLELLLMVSQLLLTLSCEFAKASTECNHTRQLLI